MWEKSKKNFCGGPKKSFERNAKTKKIWGGGLQKKKYLTMYTFKYNWFFAKCSKYIWIILTVLNKPSLWAMDITLCENIQDTLCIMDHFDQQQKILPDHKS